MRTVGIIGRSTIEDGTGVGVHDDWIIRLGLNSTGLESHETDADAHVHDHHRCGGEDGEPTENLGW